MKTYKVTIVYSVTTKDEVEAEDETEAIRIARDEQEPGIILANLETESESAKEITR